MENRNPLLEIRDLSVEFRTDDGIVKAVNQMDLTLEKGKTLGLVGETGAGKTTTALSILRLIPDPPGVVTGGSVTLSGIDILKAGKREMKRLRGSLVSMIFQDPMTSLNPVIPVGEQIAEVFYLHDKISRREAEEKAGEMLETVGIPAARGKDYPHQFSGGMKQRVVIAMALACNPELLIADEPTTALDVTIQAQVLELMKKLKQEYQTCRSLTITHDLGVVAEDLRQGGGGVRRGGGGIRNASRMFIQTHGYPYTVGLFDSLPDIKARTTQLG